MATAPEAAMMDMPQEAAPNPFADPNTMAVYDQMRQSVSPKEFGDEMLAGASQASPEDVAAFRSALEQVELPPEALDLLNNMVDEILANPEKYEEIRAKYSEMGAPDEILPEQFDPQFFAALNMAVDQMIGEPAGVQAFAKGGIAELTPIAKAIAGYGRNGDTMLAHITPAEARMLRRKGGSGTINPDTGLPEYFSLSKLWKAVTAPLRAVGKAVKKFASSTVGRIVTTVALGFFLGPAAASFMGVGSAAGVAAVSGFVGSAGSTLLGGGNLKDALKAGAIGGLTAGAIGGVTQGFDAAYTGPTTIGGQVDRFTNAMTPTASGIQTPAIDAGGQVSGLSPIPEQTFNPLDPQYATPAEIARVENMNPAIASDSTLARQQQLGLSPEAPAQALRPGEIPSNNLIGGRPTIPANAAEQVYTAPPVQAPVPPVNTTPTAGNTIAPPIDATQFEGSLAKMPPASEPSFFDKAKTIYNENFSPSGIQQQGVPAAQEAGAKAVTELTTRVPDATPAMKEAAYQNAYKATMPGALATYGPITGAGIAALGAFGGFKPGNVAQPAMKTELLKPATQRIAEQGKQREYYLQNLPGVKYDAYGAPIYDSGLGVASLLPRKFAEGGTVEDLYTKVLGRQPDAEGLAFWKNAFGDTVDDTERASFMKSVGSVLATDPSKTATLAPNLKTINDAYAGIGRTGIGTEANQIDQGGYDYWLNEMASGRISAADFNKKFNQTVESYVAEKPNDKYSNQVAYDDLVKNAYAAIGRTGFGSDVKQIDQGGYDFWMSALRNGTFNDASGKVDLNKFNTSFNNAVTKYKEENSDDALTKYVSTYKPVDVTSKYLTPSATAATGNVARLNSPAAYANINAGLSYDTPAGQAAPAIAAREAAFAPLATYKTAQTAIGNALAPVATASTVPQLYNKSPFTVTGPTSIAPPAAAAAVAPSAVMQDPRVVAAMQATTPAPNTPAAAMNMGGIASLRSGGYPRRTGQINGPGTATSDSIPAMLSDGEFVMTAKAVRGAGKGDRRAGAKRMYALMNQLEQNAARG